MERDGGIEAALGGEAEGLLRMDAICISIFVL